MLVVDRATKDFVGLVGPARAQINHLPGLDGLRALAVIAVLAFHAGFDWMVGGYLGVSTFFTLSGFLITTLLLHEHRRSGTVDLRSFWSRRYRRLWPASLVVLAAVALLFAPFVATAAQRASMRGDLLTSLFEVANWHFILTGDSYSDLFVAPSPVLHFWSLAIEEQFYLLFPVLILALWKWSSNRPGRLAAGLAVLAVCSVLEPFVFDMSDDRIYFGTDTRAAELLLGALLAVALSSDRVRVALVARRFWRIGLPLAGLVAFAVQSWWWWSLPQDTWWLYRGGFAFYAVLSCVVITAVAMPTGPLAALCGLWALRWIGVRSYGIYLIHWPIYLTVWQTWPDLARVWATCLAIGTTMVIATALFRWLERPVRRSVWPASGRGVGVTAIATATVLVAIILPLPGSTGETKIDFEQALAEFNEVGNGASTSAEATGPEPPAASAPAAAAPAAAAPTSGPATPPPMRIAIFGDSTALTAGVGFYPHAIRAGLATFSPGDVVLGCGVSRFEQSRVDVVIRPREECRDWRTLWPTLVDAGGIDVALLMSSVWELPDSVLADGTAGAIGDPAIDAFIRAEFTDAVDVLASTGALVVLVNTPPFGSQSDDGRNEYVDRQYDPQRTARLNELLAEVAASRPGTAAVLDLASALADRVEDRSLRPDGVHYDQAEFAEFTESWFMPELRRIHDRLRPTA